MTYHYDPADDLKLSPELLEHLSFYPVQFYKELSYADNTAKKIGIYKSVVTQLNEDLFRCFHADLPIEELVLARALVIDKVLIEVWQDHFHSSTAHEITLVAVGGYGRAELHPYSDIDLLILLRDHRNTQFNTQIQKFLACLWDIKLDIGHSVRSLKDCVQQARADITVATNLMEARLIFGDAKLLTEMSESTGPLKVWPGHKFFSAKRDEQSKRHHRFNDTAYNLEPNIKEGPGGLRDIQTIGWVAKRHFSATTLRDLLEHKFLTENELNLLLEGQNWLWKIRFALHMLTGRHEDRILFDFQKDLADLFGYKDTHVIAVEQFMQHYYKTVMELERLNEMLLQLFQEVILDAKKKIKPKKLNQDFQTRGGYIEAIDTELFQQRPTAMLELFLLLEINPKLKGVRASTIRLIRTHLHLIDDKVRQSPEARQLFIDIIKQPQGVTHELRRMNRYGVLASYLPVFANIVGRMQYDLFHVYTVDEHTLFVVRNLRRLTVPKYYKELPLCSDVMRNLAKPELLYIAGLFHDIAKGRGGDHSELGSKDAENFCINHGITEFDTTLVSWLVNSHLLMSTTAQKKDISDPAIIYDFASLVGDKLHLDCLYILTVCDIRGTSPSLWNSWKASLLEELYHSTKSALQRGLEHPIAQQERIEEVRNAALKTLQKKYPLEKIEGVWGNFSKTYFLRYHPDEISWQTSLIINADINDLPLIKIYDYQHLGTTNIFIYTHDQDFLFTAITSSLEMLNLNTLDARIVTTHNKYTLNTYLIHDNNSMAITASNRKQEIIAKLLEAIKTSNSDQISNINKRTARQLKFMGIRTDIVFEQDKKGLRTVLKIKTTDRPGLLSYIGQAFRDCGIRLQNARIATFGATAEDTFIITDQNDQALTDAQQFKELEQRIYFYLGESG